MRAAFLGFVTNFGGATRSTVELAQRLGQDIHVSILDVYGSCGPFRQAVAQAGLDYHVIYPTDQGRVIGGGGPVGRAVQMVRALPHLIGVRRRTLRLLKRLNPDVVWVNHFKCASLVCLAPQFRSLPVVLYLRGWYTPDMMPAYGRWLCRRRAAAIFALSYATRAALICSGVPARKIHVLHNPLDVADYSRLATRALQKPLPQAERGLRILLPADIIRAKGQHTAVQAMRHILDAGQDAVLWLAGAHAWPYGDNRNYLAETQASAVRLNVADRVEWLGRRDDMPQVMAAATVVILPSHSEGQGRVLLEAMGVGKPVAACPSGGILDMVCHNVTGQLFDVDDDRGLADCVLRYVKQTAWTQRIVRQAQDYVRQSFQPEQQARIALDVLCRAAGSGPASP